MSLMDAAVVLLGIALVATWAIGWRLFTRMTSELDEFARDRVEPDELQASVGRTLGQLQLAADDLADALATRTERLRELLAQADAQASMLGEAIALAATLTERADAEGFPSGADEAPGAAPSPEGSWAGFDARPVVGSDFEDAPSMGLHAGAAANGAAHDLTPAGEAPAWAAEVAGEGPALAVVPEGAPILRPGIDEVRRMAQDGLDMATIARRTNRGREEVRLLLRFAGAAAGTDGHREPDGPARQAAVAPGSFRRP